MSSRWAAVRLQQHAQLALIRTRKLSHFGAIAVELEGGHRSHAALLAHLLIGVDINLDEVHQQELFGHRCESRADHFAWPAPRCGEVDGNQLAVRVVERAGKLLGRVELPHHAKRCEEHRA